MSTNLSKALAVVLCVVMGTQIAPAQDTTPSSPALPFEVSNELIDDLITGPRILNFKEITPGWDVSGPELTYARVASSPNGGNAKILVAATDFFFTGKQMFLLTPSGPQPTPKDSTATVDNQTHQRFVVSHRVANLNILATDHRGLTHHILMSQSSKSLNLDVLGDITDSTDCLSAPGIIHVKWDNQEYDDVIVMKAEYGPEDSPSAIVDDRECIDEHGLTLKSKFTTLSMNDPVFPTAKNLYFQYLHSIYVIPLQYFALDAPSNFIVFRAKEFETQIELAHNKLTSGNGWRGKCKQSPVDCAQQLLDQTMIHLTTPRRG